MAFMTHPLHGAINTSDIDGHILIGWSVSTPEQWIAQKTVDENPVEIAPIVEAKKRGRPPVKK
jgi:hypothetical protein